MRLQRLLAGMVFLLLLSPSVARADGLFSPFIGGAKSEMTYGLSFGAMGRKAVGIEVDFGFTPSFFEAEGVTDDSNLLTIMGNLIVGAPIGAVRPYGSGGVGLIRSRLSGLSDLINVSRNDLGINVGGGLMGFFNDSVGLRGDFRYFRSLEKEDEGLLALGLGTFDFWRGTIGLVVSF